MPHTALTPVFVGLRTGLHVLFAALAVLVIVRAVISPTESSVAAIVLTLVMIATYGVGAVKTRTTGQSARALRLLWLAALTLEWVVLLWLTPEAERCATNERPTSPVAPEALCSPLQPFCTVLAAAQARPGSRQAWDVACGAQGPARPL